MKRWVNDTEGEMDEMAEVQYAGIADRTERDTCYWIGGEEVWIPNDRIHSVDEMRGTLLMSRDYAVETLGLSVVKESEERL